jgi:biopolymer transport protein ExbD
VAPNDDRRSIVTGINVTPMIDVLLVLLVTFFLLNLPMPHINVVVPSPFAGVDGGAPHQLVLELPDAGGYQLNGQPVPDDQFEEVIRSAFAMRPVKLLFVAAGGERTYQEVVTAVDRARGAGVQVVAFMPAASLARTSR